MIEKIINKGKLFSIILRSNYKFKNGTEFLTPDQSQMQLGLIKRDKNQEIKVHYHNEQIRTINKTSETLIIKKGKVIVDFFDLDKQLFNSVTLSKGDIILLLEGGHGFKFLQDSEIVEIKQGPFFEGKDKIYEKSI